ncbi:hypothetical protein [Jiella mangrovi]|uniref:Uncharacterized protein n=1 Tax=Jiella mangrovi TaxID=2821407 RepID=A0ABS4BD61_9HYPH|nr:hypothetical protein [Jiella mangrovi]MBP0614687.1 hypothetical protein [Jiella mangrovi]
MFGHLRFLLPYMMGLSIHIVLAAPTHAAEDGNRLTAFFAGQGCAIGPSTRQAAMAAGFDGAAIDELAQMARADHGAVETGSWLVLAPSRCTIEVPQITSEVKPSDPEVTDSLFADDEAGKGMPCFVNGDRLYENLQRTRLWDPERAFHAYVDFIAAGLRAGEIAFYSDDPLRTPMGFQLTTGECALRPEIEDIRRDHDFFMTHFDELIRTDALTAECEADGSPSWKLMRQIEPTDEAQTKNQWTFMEIKLITMAAGWMEGMSARFRGVPRPPLCHYSSKRG